jgi:predicted Zn finger-like uncharacterized protein
VVIGCPKCRARLNIPDEKIGPAGSKFKCPKCQTVLKVRKPQAAPARPLDNKRILVAHERPEVIERVKALLAGSPIEVTPAGDGIATLSRILKELPFLIVVDAALPKIDGYEVARRLKTKKETRDIKVIVMSSRQDPGRPKRLPPDAHGVNGYVDEGELEAELKHAMYAAMGIAMKEPAQEPPRPAPAAPPVAPAPGTDDKDVKRAKRLARTVLSDIELYSPEKVAEAVKTGNFESVFAGELKEGLKHYENRIPASTRGRGNFFQVAIDEFIQKKKETLGIA